jgi:gamma-glutamyltranspeptidase
MQQNPYSSRQEISGTFGAVSSTHWIATQIGMNILEKGGNAFDAAVAIAFTLHVVEPHQNSLGGEAVILIHPNGAAAPTVVCGQGAAPAKATIGYFKSLGLAQVPSNGLLAAVVPGAFGAWMLMFRDYGTLPLEAVLGPAIAYAANGAPLLPEARQRISKAAPLFREHWTTSAQIYLPRNSIPEAGELLRNEELAQTYERILSEATSAGCDRTSQIEMARKTFYEGFVADRICKFCADTAVEDSSGSAHVGLLDFDDMGSWQPTYETAASIDFRGFRVFKPGFWTQGPAFLQFLGLVDGFDLFGLHPFGPEYIHNIVEALKLAYADREAWYGEAECNGASVSGLLDEDYISRRRRLISSGASARLAWQSRASATALQRERFRRAWRGTAAAHAAGCAWRRGYMPFGRCRPMGERRRGDAIGRMAIRFSGHSRPGLCAQYPGPDVLAAGRSKFESRPANPSPHHAVADDCACRRSGNCIRNSRCRLSGPVECAIFPSPSRIRHGSAGGVGCPELPQ